MKRVMLIVAVFALSACASPATPPPTAAAPEAIATPAPQEVSADVELLVMQQASQILGCAPANAPAAGTFGFFCEAGAGHGTAATLTRHADESTARAAFDSQRAGNPLYCFHGFPAATWEQSADVGKHRLHAWVAGNWLIVADAFDDTDIITALAPFDVSEAIFNVADINGYLPAVTEGGECG
ncbi:MAG: hypothetical protein FJ030_07710 [Chloroflexi bacterium]|nr:hypothetical protein [Chloroflexota bacterium]